MEARDTDDDGTGVAIDAHGRAAALDAEEWPVIQATIDHDDTGEAIPAAALATGVEVVREILELYREAASAYRQCIPFITVRRRRGAGA